MFRTVSPSIIRSLKLYIQHQVYVMQVLWLLASKQPQNLYVKLKVKVKLSLCMSRGGRGINPLIPNLGTRGR